MSSALKSGAWTLLTVVACGGSSDTPDVVRLVDAFASASVVGTASNAEAPEASEWRFAEGELAGFVAGPGVSGLTVEDGRLSGRSSTDNAVVRVERPAGFDATDLLHAFEIRVKVSDGANLWVGFSGSDEPNVERMVERAKIFPWPLSTPIVSGDELRTYTISAASAAQASIKSADTRHIFIRPTDVSGARFEIESVRLIFRKEHLASIPAGVGWHGLSEVYRETIVTRAPESATFSLSVPERAFLDLAIGTVEDGPVTFRVSANDEVLIERTVTTPNRWEEVPMALDGLSGQVSLELSLHSDKPGAIGFWGAPALRSRASKDESRPRGVIVILIDTLRRDHLEAYGYGRETAPHVNRLAAEGTLFRDAIAQGAWTKVSVPSMLSSTYPTSNGIYEFTHKLPASADTIAESFRENGYATWVASANGFSGTSTNLHQGVEVLHENGSLVFPEGQPRGKSARILADRLLPWLDTHSEIPFFVFFHALDPHSAYEPYRPYDTLWAAPDGKTAHEERVEKVRPFIKSDFMKPMGLPLRSELEEAGVDPDVFVNHEIDWYDGSIRGADAEVGRVLERLRDLGLEDDTLVVFLSDHGEEFLDHGGHFHEENVYGEMVNVPLIMRWPARIPAGLVIEQTVQMLDVGPTLLELAGITKPGLMQGESLAALFDDQRRWTPRPAISEWTRRTDQREQDMVDAVSIIDGDYKLVHNIHRPEGFPEFELYHHRDDPLDQNDIASDHPEIVEQLSQQLQDWQKWAQARALPTNAEATEGLDSEELERLRSLGYVQ